MIVSWEINYSCNLVPRVLFPGFGCGAPHLQSQGKAPWGRGCNSCWCDAAVVWLTRFQSVWRWIISYWQVIVFFWNIGSKPSFLSIGKIRAFSTLMERHHARENSWWSWLLQGEEYPGNRELILYWNRIQATGLLIRCTNQVAHLLLG